MIKLIVLLLAICLLAGCSGNEDTTYKPSFYFEEEHLDMKTGVFLTTYGFRYVRYLDENLFLQKKYFYNDDTLSYIEVIIHCLDTPKDIVFEEATAESLTREDFKFDDKKYTAILSDGKEVASLLSMTKEEGYQLALLQYELLIS